MLRRPNINTKGVLAVSILGLAANEIASQVIPPVPTTPRYADFVGAFGIIVAAFGAASLFINRISPKIPLALDALLALIFLSGGIVSHYSFPFSRGSPPPPYPETGLTRQVGLGCRA